jgi:hypothetical protein
MAKAGAIVSTTLLEVIIFSRDKDTKEYDGRKHIGAADLLRKMARRKAANSAWSDRPYHQKRLKFITTNWKEFEIVFRRAWKIKATNDDIGIMDGE